MYVIIQINRGSAWDSEAVVLACGVFARLVWCAFDGLGVEVIEGVGDLGLWGLVCRLVGLGKGGEGYLWCWDGEDC